MITSWLPFSELLDYDNIVKNERMIIQGFSMDSTGHFNGKTTNHGLKTRRDLFLDSKSTGTEALNVFTGESVTLLGVLNTNFMSLHKRK
jgi:hypothetical protein